MARTPEQRAADELMAQAVHACAVAYGFVTEHHHIVDHITVVEAVAYDDDPDEFDEFRGIIYRPGMRRSVATGLLRLGEGMVGEDAMAAQYPPDDQQYGQ